MKSETSQINTKLPKHHYIPAFYLKQWANARGRLIEFSKPHENVVKPRPTSPDGTGYIRGLNIVKGLPPERSDLFETINMHRVDNAAADALAKLLSDDDAPWTPKPKSAWTRFLISLMIRLPERLTSLKQFLLDDTVPLHQEQRRKYEAEKKTSDPDFDEFLSRNVDQAAFDVVQRLLNNQQIGRHINGMIWNVVTVNGTKHELLTSDRPVIITNGIGHADSHIILPITPTKLFAAVNTRDELLRLQRLPANKFVEAANRTVVANAIRHVWGRDDRQLRFVQNHMSSTAASDLSLMPKIATSV